MKKHLIALMIVAVFVPALAFGQVSTLSYSPKISASNKPLKLGSKGSEVILLQGFLAKQGLMSSNLLTGNFGPVTKKSVVAFQKLAGLPADGIVGSGTLFFMQNIMYPGLVLKDASKPTISYLQGLYKESKIAGVNKTKSTSKEILTNLLSVTPLKHTNNIQNINNSTNTGNSFVLSPNISQLNKAATTQKNNTNTDATKSFSGPLGVQKQYSCTFTSKYTQICLPIKNQITSNLSTNLGNNSTNQQQIQIQNIKAQNNQIAALSGLLNQSSLNINGSVNNTINSSSNLSANGLNTTAQNNSPLFWYCNDPSCNTLSATTTPWWQSSGVSVNPEIVNACVPLSGYDIKFKLTAEDMFSVYAYKEDSKGKVTEMVPVCKDMKTSVYGVPSWKTIESCKKFRLNEDQHLALVVADDGKIAEGWIGRLEIVGNVYFSQDFAWEHIISSTKLPKTYTDFSTNQLMQEMNTGIWKPTSILGPMGIDPWGFFSDDTSLDDASWVKVQDPGQDKFSVFRLKNCGVATPASSVNLTVDGGESIVIDSGSSVDLDWNVANVSSCTATSTPNNSAWNGTKSINGGSLVVNNLNQNTTFNISCNSEAGLLTDSVQVFVKPFVDLKVNNNNSTSVAHDSVVSLTWSSSNATYCVASGGSIDWEDSNNSFGQISANGSFTTGQLPADEIFNFIITCTGLGGSTIDSVSVEVGPQPSILLQSNNTSINSGENIILSWSPKFVNSCTATSTPNNNAWNGAKSINNSSLSINNLNITTEFKLTCVGPFSEIVSDSVIVNVNGGNTQPSVELVAERNSVPMGGSVYFTWTTQNVTGNFCNATNSANNSGFKGSKPLNSDDVNFPFIFPIYQTITFTLTCSSAAGPVQDSVTIEVNSSATNGSPYILNNTMMAPVDKQAYYIVYWSKPVYELNFSNAYLKVKSSDDNNDGDLQANNIIDSGDILVYFADYLDNPDFTEDDFRGIGTLHNSNIVNSATNEVASSLSIPNTFSF